MARQIRRVILPTQVVIDYLNRHYKDHIQNGRLHRCHADPHTGQIFLHVEHDGSDPAQLVLDVDWNQVFGIVPCAHCGVTTGVENLTVCETCRKEKLPKHHGC
jgi:hypothetical protein